jgi:hypothetical protein
MKKANYKLIIGSMLLATTLVGCGGGGDGGASAPAAVTYTGKTTQAAVNKTNTVALAEGTLISGNSGSGVGTNPLGVATSGRSRPALPGLARTLGNVLPRIQPQNSTSSTLIGVTQSNTFPSDCGTTGSLTFTVTVSDTVPTDSSGSATFNNFDGCNGVINGSVSFSATGGSATIVFTNLTFTDGVDTLAMGGTITTSMATSSTGVKTASLSMDMSFVDAAIMYRIDNFRMTVTDMVTYEVINIASGRFYHSVEGYIDVTATNISIPNGATTPTSGELVITGASNAGNSSNAHVIFGLTDATIHVDADDVPGFESTATCVWGKPCTIL